MKELGWQKLKDRQHIAHLKFIHRIVHGTAPSLCNRLPQTVGEYTQRVLRNTGNFVTTKTNTEKFRNSCIHLGFNTWNNLDESIKSIDNINSFVRCSINYKRDPVRKFINNYGERRCNIILARIRMGCSALNAHLYSLHVIDIPSCACGLGDEDADHYFLNCPLYTVPRRALRDVVGRFALDLNTSEELTNGNINLSISHNIQILQAVYEFILNTQRF